MSLGLQSKALLDVCASAIAINQPTVVNLGPLFHEEKFRTEGPTYLAEAVEKASCSRFSVRIADSSLFDEHLPGIVLYLVRCAVDTPSGPVTNLSGGMSLITVSAKADGCQLYAKEASPEMVKSHRAIAARAKAKQAEKAKFAELAKVEVNLIAEALQQLVDDRTGDDETMFIYVSPDPTMSQIATVCHRFNVSVKKFLAQALR